MSAEVLRRAAALMRGRAEVARSGPWEAGERCVWTRHDGSTVIDDGLNGDGGCVTLEDADHIASWHPDVALLVARLLNDTAETWEMCDRDDDFRSAVYTIAVGYTRDYAMNVARAYLGESS